MRPRYAIRGPASSSDFSILIQKPAIEAVYCILAILERLNCMESSLDLQYTAYLARRGERHPCGATVVMELVAAGLIAAETKIGIVPTDLGRRIAAKSLAKARWLCG